MGNDVERLAANLEEVLIGGTGSLHPDSEEVWYKISEKIITGQNNRPVMSSFLVEEVGPVGQMPRIKMIWKGLRESRARVVRSDVLKYIRERNIIRDLKRSFVRSLERDYGDGSAEELWGRDI